MGRKSNFEKKQDIVLELLKNLKKNLNGKTYRSYEDDIRFKKTTVNQLTKIQKDLELIPKFSKNIKKQQIKNSYVKQQEQIKEIMNVGNEYSQELATTKINRTSNKLDRYKQVQYSALDFYFREYQNDNFDKLNMYIGMNVYPNYGFIKPLVINKLETLRKEISNKLQLHTYITIKYLVKQIDDYGEISYEDRFFNSSSILISSNNQINQFYNMIVDEFNNKIEEDRDGSDWLFEGILKLKIKINIQKSILGKGFIELPDFIKYKKCCVNPKNDDDECFKWCLIMAKHYIDIKNHHRSEIKYYKKYKHEIIEPENFQYPVQISDIPEFERLNNMKINVLNLDEDNKITSEYTSMERNENVVTLMLIHEGEKSHYVWVKSESALFASKTSHYKKHVCLQCLTHSFDCQRKLDEHMEICKKQLESNCL